LIINALYTIFINCYKNPIVFFLLEAIMLERTPAFAVDYLSCIQDKFEETEEDSDDEDAERYLAVTVTD
jgi:hypothetical protein